MKGLTHRTSLVYALLLAAVGMIAAWQAVEHARVRKSARAALINRAKDISTTLGLLMRSQRFFGVISKERLESALRELVKPGELNAIALLNAAGEVVASAGESIDLQPRGVVRPGEYWENQSVTVMTSMDLGTNVTRELERTNLTMVLPQNEIFRSFETNRPPPPREFDGGLTGVTNGVEGSNFSRGGPGWDRPGGTNDTRPRFGRPRRMNEDEYRTMFPKRGVHSFVLVMSTLPVRAIDSQDLWLRSLIVTLAVASVVGSGLAWRNLATSSALQVRLVRASEMNTHLKELNLAAAGLAHETRNPLNIIRGLAHIISRDGTVSPDIQARSRAISEEVDRVTAHLNEFINYSRPREVRPSDVPLGAVIAEVVRALNYDIEEKHLRVHVRDEGLVVQADEQLLRQALFNLLINAIQAVDPTGHIWIAAEQADATEAALEVRDNGPGVAAEHRDEIFKPYFTMHEKGTGLGLAVVQQIVSAHGWGIQCLPNEPRGAVFRVSHLKLSSAA